MIVIDDWRKTYQDLQSVGIYSPANVIGVCKKVLGARALYAEAELHITQSTELKFASELSDLEYQQAYDERWLKGIYLGVLDVMLVRPLIPITVFECTVKAIRFHEVDSTAQAFRLAGRYAAEKFLEQEKFVTI